MRAHCIIFENPFEPLERSVATLRRPVKIKRLAPRGDRPAIARLNGEILLRWPRGRPDCPAERRQQDMWRRRLRHGDHLTFHVLPRGRALQAILSIALLAFVPGLVAGWGGLFATTSVLGVTSLTMFGNVAVAAIGLAGTALISALVPQPHGQGALSIPAASPTYSLQAQGNSARLEQPVPVQYGRMLFSPDFAAQPYTEFAGNEQYLYQLLCIGVGEFQVDEIRIEDTPITAFPEVTTEIVAPGGQVTLFPTAVISSVEVAGQDMPGVKLGTWARTTTTVTVTETAHGRVPGQAVTLAFTTGGGPDGSYAIATVPTVDTFTVTTVTGAGSGNVSVAAIVGGISGFIASGPGTLANRLACDVVLPRGLYSLSGSNLLDLTLGMQFWARQIDDNGLPLAAWILLGSPSVTNRTSTPQRLSFSFPLGTPGRYAVLALRTDAKSVAAGVGHDLAWTGLRAYLQSPQSFGPVTLLAVRMRASGSLSSFASRKMKVLAQRKLPVWNGTSWSAPVVTSSIAWAIADAARDANYGAGLTDARLDLAALLALDAVWAARGDSFNGRFDQAGTWWDAVMKIAAAGRARPFMQGGIVRVVRDGPVSVPVAMFTMRNIVKGSFNITYLTATDATADKVEVSYFDAIQWTAQRVSAVLAGSAALKPVKVELFGITDRAQALREGLYLAAANKYRTRIMTFQTEMEGFIPSLGDLIAVQHDMPAWGAQAEAVVWNAATRTLTLNEPMTFGAGSYYVALRRRDGSASGPWLVTAGATAYDVILAATPDITPDVGGDRERTHVAFGGLGLGVGSGVWAKVLAVRPRGLDRVEIEAVLEDGNVHTADTGVTAPPVNLSGLPRAVTVPVVTGLIGRSMPGDNTRVLIAWQPARGAETYQVEMAEGTDVNDPNVTWTRVADTSAAHYVARLLAPAQSMIRVRGIGLTAGTWNATTIGTLIPQMWNDIDTTPMWGIDTDPMWSD